MIDPAKREVLMSLAPFAAGLMRRHEKAKAKHEWLPAQLLKALSPVTERVLSWGNKLNEIDGILENVRKIPGALRAAFALNFLTEEDLPHFVSLIFFHVGDDGVYTEWANRWAAEEQVHGSALYTYALQTDLVDRTWLEQLRFAYVLKGFWPEWKRNPYRLIAYATLQELATQISHQNLGKLIEPYEGLLGKLFKHIAGDETRHHVFYRDLFKEILERDPSEAMIALSDVASPFVMPGASMPHYQELLEIQNKLGIFTSLDYSRIVETLNKFWKIEALTGLTVLAEEARRKILRLPAIHERIGKRLAKVKEYRLPFLNELVTI